MTQATARHILVETEEQCLSLKAEIEAGLDFAEAAKKIHHAHQVVMVEI
jgi:peptidyl-prolyl cis-trans isomerase C